MSGVQVATGWGGFVDGELHWMEVDCGWGGYNTGDFVLVPAIFKTKKEGRKKYEDVRRIICERKAEARRT